MSEPRRAPADAVAEALREVAELRTSFAVTVGGPDEGWHPVQDSYARGIPDLIAATARRHNTEESRIAASIAQLGHAARLWSPVLACTVVHGIVPNLTGLQRADRGPTLRLPEPAGWYARDYEWLARSLYRIVVADKLNALAAGLRVKVAPGLLYGNAASALAEAARAVYHAHPDLAAPLTTLTTRLLTIGRLAGTGHLTGPDFGFRRRSCCLFYRAPTGSHCTDCALTSHRC